MIQRDHVFAIVGAGRAGKRRAMMTPGTAAKLRDHARCCTVFVELSLDLGRAIQHQRWKQKALGIFRRDPVAEAGPARPRTAHQPLVAAAQPLRPRRQVVPRRSPCSRGFQHNRRFRDRRSRNRNLAVGRCRSNSAGSAESRGQATRSGHVAARYRTNRGTRPRRHSPCSSEAIRMPFAITGSLSLLQQAVEQRRRVGRFQLRSRRREQHPARCRR